MYLNSPLSIRGQRVTVAVAEIVATVFLTTAICGCSREDAHYPSVRLEGNVTIAGKPLADGLIMFMPLERGRGGGVKAVIKEGRYVADRVPTGKVLVTFNAMQETGRMVESPSSPGKPLPERIDLLPAKYKSGVSLDVKGEQLRRDFDL